MQQRNMKEYMNQYLDSYQIEKVQNGVIEREKRNNQQILEKCQPKQINQVDYIKNGYESMSTSSQKQINDIIENISQAIKLLILDVQNLKQSILQIFDSIQYLSEQWHADLNIIANNRIKANKIIFQQNRKEYENLIYQTNLSYFAKIMLVNEKMKKIQEQNGLEKYLENLINYGISNYEQQSKQQFQINNSVSYKLLGQIDQQEMCYSLAFNKDGTIMVSGSNEQIKIWQFQNGGLMDCIQIIKGDNDIDYATCLIFSKKSNSFISGSFNASIKMYFEHNGKWQKSHCYQYHDGLVTCIILSNQEDQLFSCSQDFHINIWKIDFVKNSLIFDQQLKKHEKVVFSVNINKYDTELVSTSLDKKIIIWNKDNNNKWSFNYLIDHSINDYGCTISYVTDSIIAWQQSNQPYLHLFQQENGIYVQKEEMKFEIPDSQGQTNLFLFPNIFNKEKQTLILKFNEMIYFIHYENRTQTIKLASEPIQCSNNATYGNSSLDGKYLVLWDYKIKKYNIYELFYY